MTPPDTFGRHPPLNGELAAGSSTMRKTLADALASRPTGPQTTALPPQSGVAGGPAVAPPKPEPQVAVWFGILSGELQQLGVSVDALTAKINPVVWAPGTLEPSLPDAEVSLPPLAPLADALRTKALALRGIVARIDEITRCVEL